MELVRIEQDRIIAKKNDKANYWYLIQEGTVIQRFEYTEVVLEKNAIIGIFERDIYLCDYVAAEDVVLAAFVCNDSADIKNIITGQEKARNIFLRAAMTQRHQLLILYSDLNKRVRQFHQFVESLYNEYKVMCNKYRIEVGNFSPMEMFTPLEMKHKAEVWEINNSVSIMKNFLSDYLSLMSKDDSLTLGVIMETSAQMRRFAQGIREMEDYLLYHKDILIGESNDDLFTLFFDLSVKMYAKKHDIEAVTKNINSIAQVAGKLGVYNMRMVARRFNDFKSFDYESILSDKTDGTSAGVRKEMDITKEDCMTHILKYAGYSGEEMDGISEKIEGFMNLPDRMSSDSHVYSMRRQVSSIFYEVYQKVFLRAVKDESTLTPILDMFLNFGFMDVSFVGEENAKALYNLAAHLEICRSERIYTIYQWLKCIYRGRKENSKSEMDINYREYLAEEVKSGKLTKDEMEENLQNGEKRIEYEIKNMFPSVNKITYGRITTFCPILTEYDLNNSIDKMLVTADRLEEAMNSIRRVDYSVFYREVFYSGSDGEFQNEKVMKEILPDIILMPNAGSRVIMWQETAGKKNDTPARFMFPIFTLTDLNSMMLEVMGAFRWEMCRKVQGFRWNDIRDASLTAEYCSYLQFYGKNRELSADAKTKIKGSLTKAKNNFREVFVRDYINWINYESKGSFRLNKVSRDILVRYCPFVKAIRQELMANPIYQASLTRFENETTQKLKKYKLAYDKYEKDGGTLTEELKQNLLFYQM